MPENDVEFVREAARNIPVYKKQGVSPRKIDIPTLRKTLEKQGVNLRKDAIDLSEVRKNIERRGAKISRIV